MNKVFSSVGDTLISIATVVVYIAIAAVTMACVWTVVECMRMYGTDLAHTQWLSLDAARIAEAATHAYQPGTFLGGVEAVLKWYNLTFIGAARFGSGLGIFIGAYLALSFVKERSIAARIACCLIAGAFMGGRLFLMVTSDVRWFLFGALLGAVVLAACELKRTMSAPLPELPAIAR